MIKKAALAAGAFTVSAMIAGTVAFAQTSTPAPTYDNTTNATSNTTTTVTPSVTKTVPSGAPATGRQ